MNNLQIDYNTANIVFEIKTSKGELKVFLPPANSDEIKSNALILGKFVSIMQEVNEIILLKDYDIYLDEIIEELASKKYNNNNDTFRIKYEQDLNIKIRALLERSIISGYYVDNNEIKPLSELSEEIKFQIKGYLLFFIVSLRYIMPMLTTEEWAEKMKMSKILFTSLNATDWLNTIMTASSKKETSEA